MVPNLRGQAHLPNLEMNLDELRFHTRKPFNLPFKLKLIHSPGRVACPRCEVNVDMSFDPTLESHSTSAVN